jgi:hypothetical protein
MPRPGDARLAFGRTYGHRASWAYGRESASVACRSRHGIDGDLLEAFLVERLHTSGLA